MAMRHLSCSPTSPTTLDVQHSAGQASFISCSPNRLQNLPQVKSSALQALNNADHFNLVPLIQFDRRVFSVEKVSDGWQVLLDNSEIF